MVTLLFNFDANRSASLTVIGVGLLLLPSLFHFFSDLPSPHHYTGCGWPNWILTWVTWFLSTPLCSRLSHFPTSLAGFNRDFGLLQSTSSLLQVAAMQWLSDKLTKIRHSFIQLVRYSHCFSHDIRNTNVSRDPIIPVMIMQLQQQGKLLMRRCGAGQQQPLMWNVLPYRVQT